MREDLEQLKQRIPLLQYLQRLHWTGYRRASFRPIGIQLALRRGNWG
jgi:hypothetical protein